jgi:N-acetylglutamate synthase-like GNAT family acetyltransferase
VSNPPVSAAWRVRPARPEDLPSIRELVTSVGGDLEDLQSKQFVVAADAEDKIIGCGRLKPYPGFCELASIAVSNGWRSTGVGKAVVRRLLESHQGPVYLICEDNVVEFFRRFGFDLVPRSEMASGLQSKLERYIAQVGNINAMRRD